MPVAELDRSDSVVVTHGTVLSLWLSQQVNGFDAVSFWLDLEMPDAWRFDDVEKSIQRVE